MGIILPQTIKTKWASTNKQYYINKGYTFTKIGNEFDVNVLDLSENSKRRVWCICDFCGKKFLSMFKRANPNRKVKYESEKLSCCSNKNQCMVKKLSATNKERYGVPFVTVLDTVKEKMEQSLVEHYGVKNAMYCKEIKDKLKKTNKEKYGVEYAIQNKEIKDKIKQINKERYGYYNVMQNKEIQEKVKQTNLKRYGYEYLFQSKEIQEKSKQTMKQRYGVEYAIQNKEIQDKIKQTNKERYGSECLFQSQQIKDKTKQTNKEKYGYEYVLQSPVIRKKINDTLMANGNAPCSQQQKHIFDLLYNIDNNNYKLNYQVGCFSLDIVDVQNKIDIEYDGGGHNLCVKLGGCTQKEFDNKEIRRNFFVKSKGYKILRIISNNDKLPKDDILLSLINECTNYLKYTNYTWVYIDLNKQKIISHAFNKYF